MWSIEKVYTEQQPKVSKTASLLNVQRAPIFVYFAHYCFNISYAWLQPQKQIHFE